MHPHGSPSSSWGPSRNGAYTPSSRPPHSPGPQSPFGDAVSDPSRLLALYPLGTPFTPTSAVASHLASLSVTSVHPRDFLPDWSSTDEETRRQIEVLEKGPRNEEERRWFDEQAQMMRELIQGPGGQAGSIGNGSQHQLVGYQLPSNHPQHPLPLPEGALAQSFLQTAQYPAYIHSYPYPTPHLSSSSAPSPGPQPNQPAFDETDSQRFFDSFVEEEIAKMAAEASSSATARRGSSQAGGSPVSNGDRIRGENGGVWSPMTASRQGSANSSLRDAIPPQPDFQSQQPNLHQSQQHLPPPSQPIFSRSYQYPQQPHPSALNSPFRQPPPAPSSVHPPRHHQQYASSSLQPPASAISPTKRKSLESPPSARKRSTPPSSPSHRFEQSEPLAASTSLTKIKLQIPAGFQRSSPAVAIPASSALTEPPPLEEEEEGEDYRGDEIEGDDTFEVEPKRGGKKKMRESPVKMEVDSPRRVPGTLGKEDRDAKGKLRELVENIFESIDTLPHPLPSDFFSTASHTYFARTTTVNLSDPRPLLNALTLRKLAKLLGSVGKRPLEKDEKGVEAGWWASELEDGAGERLMSLLVGALAEGKEVGEEIWEGGGGPGTKVAGEDIAEVAGAGEEEDEKVGEAKGKKGKGVVAKKGKKSPVKKAFVRTEVDLEADLEVLKGKLEVTVEAGLAADCVLVLLGGRGVPKQLFSEETILQCIQTLKQHLSSIIYPFVEALSDPISITSPLLSSLIQPSTGKSSLLSTKSHFSHLAALFQTVLLLLPHLQKLIESPTVGMSDDIVIQTVYVAVSPFFVSSAPSSGTAKGKAAEKKVSEAATAVMGGKSELRGLRLDALGLVRAVFGQHEEQRAWIIQEILTSLIKLPEIKKAQKQFKLRDGRSIHIVSALLLHLVQTSTHGVREEVARKRNQTKSKMIVEGEEDEEDESEMSKGGVAVQEQQLYSAGMDAASKSARSIAIFLMQSSASGKASKSSEADYRAVLDIFLSDLVTVLHWPEWPAASLVVSYFCRIMTISLADEKSSAEDNASKAIALDHLGSFGARLRQSTVEVEARAKKDVERKGIGLTLQELSTKGDKKGLGRRVDLVQRLLSYLLKTSCVDPAFSSSYDYAATLWGSEVSVELARLHAGDGSAATGAKEIVSRLKSALEKLSEADQNNDVFSGGNANEAAAMDILAEDIDCSRPISRAFDPILGAILKALSSPSVTFRTKALRALGYIITVDSNVLRQANVRRTFEDRINDHSPAVRDAAVELLGKYLIQQPALVQDYYALIGGRVNDTGLAVRKRVVKLLKAFYTSTSGVPRRADICVKLIQRIEDEEQTVKDLAIRTIEELWFSDSSDAPNPNSKSPSPSPNGPKAILRNKAAVFTEVAGLFKERQNPLEQFLRQIVAEKLKHKDGKVSAAILAHYRELSDTLIECLIDSEDLPDFNVSNCIKAIYHLSVVYPECISTGKATTLLPYLRTVSNPDELATAGYLLKIFRACVAKMPKTASSFARDLERKLLPMINSGAGGSTGLQETIGCLCAVVNNLTRDYERIIKILSSCVAKLEAVRREFKASGALPPEQRTFAPMLFIVACLGEHCDFDEIRSISAEVSADINEISRSFISDYIFDLLCSFHTMPVSPVVKRASLISLGFLFRAYPTLMLHESSLATMDSVLASDDVDARAALLNIILDFLISQALRLGKDKDDGAESDPDDSIDMTELIGNTEGFAESGVGSTIVQRYLHQILEAALHVQTQYVAMDILSFTVKQGLAHPIQSTPIIIALETSANPGIAERAFALHTLLHHKHASIINSRFIDTAKLCFQYQQKSSGDAARGYRRVVTTASAEPIPTALFRQWYGLIREKRPLKREYLTYLVRSLDLGTPSTRPVCSSDNVGFCRYIIDNLATLDYKNQEEVFIVLDRLTAILSTSGVALFDVVCALDLEGRDLEEKAESVSVHLGAMVAEPTQFINSQGDELESSPPLAAPVEADYKALTLANLSIVISLIFVLKAHLKSLYGLTEEKCQKFTANSKKSALGDRAATRSAVVSLEMNLSRIPYALAKVETMGDIKTQIEAFITISQEDGLEAEVEGDDD